MRHGRRQADPLSRRALTAATLLAATLAAGWLATAAAAQVPDADRPAIDRAIARGTLLYHYDQAAWHGTDAMLPLVGARLGEVGGWIVDGPTSAPTITFIDKQEPPRAVFAADLRDDHVIATRLPAGPAAELAPARRRMVAALRAARGAVAGLSPCTPAPFNTIVVPPVDTAAPIQVYFLSAQTDAATLPLGGHYLVEVGADGRAGAPRPFTRTCLKMTREPEGGRPEALVMTHVLGPTPTETHVFSALAVRVPLYVGTARGTWRIDPADGTVRIALVRTRPPLAEASPRR